MNEASDARSRPGEKPVVVVTGSSGRIGRELLQRLASRFQVIGFDRDGHPQPPPEIECVCVDLTDDRSVERGVARVVHAYGGQLAAVVHLAAYYDFSGEPSALYDEVNIRGTQRLLDALRAASCSFDVFVYSSTMLVHESTEPGVPIDEASPLAAKWDYPRSKLAAERLLEERADGRVVLLRIAGIYTDRCDSIPLSQQVHRVAERQLEGHVFPGDSSHGQALVHLDDVLDALERTIDRRSTLPDGVTAILIGEPRTVAYGVLQDRLGELLHGESAWRTVEIPKAIAKVGAWVQDRLPREQFVKPWMIELADDHYELDIERANRLLGWRPRHRLEASLPAMVRDLRADPKAWRRRHGLSD